ncbi:MAG: outer membrane protein assembly factor BamA [Candidatus Omnitrophota bacterium]
MRKTFFLFFIAFFILGISHCCFAQESTQSLAPKVQPAVKSEKKVTAIEVKGNKAISTNIVISKMKTKIGELYQELVVSDDLKRLYLLGYFSDIKIDTEDYKDGLRVIVTVEERPIIKEITFSGILHITLKDEKLKEMLKSKQTQYLDYPSLAEDVQILKKMYEKMGFSNAQIDYSVDIDKLTNRAKIQFIVVENKRVSIRKIFIEGNKSFSDTRILKLLKTKSGWLFNAGILKDDVLKEDIERIKSFYNREGFPDVTVSSTAAPLAKKTYLLFITITINEGKRYLVGDLFFEGNKDISQKEIISRLRECTPGKVFSQEALKKEAMNIQALYFDKGYISVEVEEAASLNTKSGRIDIVYKITENQVAYVDKIKVKGNAKTKDIVIRRELRIMPGDKFDGDKLKRSKERLQNLGFFEDVSYDTEETPVPNKKNLVVDVRESKTGSFSFGGGYSTVDQLVGFLEIEQKNFDWKNFPYFTGAGQNLKARASFGSLSDGFQLSFTEPWVFDYPVSFGFDGYKTTHKRESGSGYGYDEDVIGGDVRLGKEISEYLNTSLTYRCDQIKIGQVSDNASADLTREVGTNVISSTTLGVSFDTRNNVFDPKKGNLVANSLELAGGPFSGDKNFVKYFLRASHYFPVFGESVLEFRGRLGVVDPFGNSTDVPIYERFFAGGGNTIRGYSERRIGPVDPSTSDPLGGESTIIVNAEYLYPVFSFIKLAAFFDTGNVWEKIDKLGSGGFKSGAGFGVRVKTPVGPIMLDYGIPFNKESGEDERGSGRFHFSVSHGF